jgi:uncharacterized membrane protein YhhN
MEPTEAALAGLRRRRRRQASLCFFVAGIGFGTAIYLLRARFHSLKSPDKTLAFLFLVAVMVALFWLGTRAESDVTQLDERLRELRHARTTRGGPDQSVK